MRQSRDFVGIGQSAARDRAANAQVIEPAFLRAQAGHDVAQTLAEGQLGKGHAEKLVPTGETPHPIVASVALHTLGETRDWADDPSIAQTETVRCSWCRLPDDPAERIAPSKFKSITLLNRLKLRYSIDLHETYKSLTGHYWVADILSRVGFVSFAIAILHLLHRR